MKLRVGAVFIPVLNLETSIEWYSECFGLQMVDNWGAGASFTFKEGESLLALIQVNELSPLDFPANGTRNVYFHFETDDMEQFKAFLEAKGIEVEKSYDHGPMTEVFIKDPSGNEISVFCEKKNSPFYQHAAGKVSW